MMDEQDVIQLLRYYQHDLLNELQIIQGYASMNKIDKVKEKIAACVDVYNKERQLMYLNSPKFALWLMKAQHHQKNIGISYDLQLGQIDLSLIDQDMFDIGTCIVEHIKQHGNEFSLYELHIDMCFGFDKAHVIVSWQITGELDDIEPLQSKLNHNFPQILTNMQTNSNHVKCEFYFNVV